MASALEDPLAPDFIRFLFSTKPKFDCYFKVGNQSQGKPERIGAVKLMLMAHSDVFRLELEDSDLKEQGDVPVKDVHPDTFKGMLKYVYGHDTTSDLCFDKADNMLYVAEKYMIKTLKDKLAVRLMQLLNPDNICSLLNNPACYTHLELDSAITEILRFETDRVLVSPQFLWMNADGFLKILEQDGLAVPEIELWRAAIKWAKHRADSEDGLLLRQQLSGLTRDLRLCTLTADEICAEVASTDVLTRDEIGAVCQSVGRKRKPEGLTEICDEIMPRKRLRRPNELKLTDFVRGPTRNVTDYSFTLVTKQDAIELLPLVCMSEKHYSMNPQKRRHRVKCSTTITKVVNPEYPYNSTNEPSITVSFSENVKREEAFKIPLTVGGENVTLLPDTKYTVKMKLKGFHQTYLVEQDKDSYGPLTYYSSHGNDHLILKNYGIHGGYYYFPFTKLQYRVIGLVE